MSTDESTPAVELALRLSNGDRSALAEIFSRWADVVFTAATMCLPEDAPESEAAEATAAAFTRLWSGRELVRPTHHTFPAWLIGLVHRVVVEQGDLRRAQLADPEAKAVDAMQERERLDASLRLVVEEALPRLSEQRRAIVRAAVVEQRAFSDIGQEHHITADEVRHHVRRGMTELRHAVQEVDHVPT